MADFILNMPLSFFARVFRNPAGDPVLLKSRGVTLLRDSGDNTLISWDPSRGDKFVTKTRDQPEPGR